MSATAANGRTRTPRVPAITPLPEPTSTPAVSRATPSLDAAVSRVIAQAQKLIRNQAGQIQFRTYGYVDLTAVMDEVLPLLVAEGLVWKTFATMTSTGAPALRYRMSHIESGEFDEDTMPLPCDATMQALGAGITYGRRYALSTYLSLTIDYDDDGWRANAQPESTVPAAAHAELITNSNGIESGASPQPSARPAKASERPITANQRTKLLIPRAQKAGLSDGEFANVLLSAAGDEPRQWRNEDHAAQTLSRLLDRCPARLKDQVLEGIAQAAAAKGNA